MNKEIRQRVNLMYNEIMSVDSVYQNYAKDKQIGYLDFLFFYELLENEDPFTQKRMCEELEISKTTCNSLVKRWIEKESIQLIPSKLNHKEKIISLTESGSQYAHDLIDPLFKMEEQAISQISDEELETVQRIIQKYKKALEDQF